MIPGLGRSPGEGKGYPTPVLWPGEFNGLYSPWCRKELDMTEHTHAHTQCKWDSLKLLCVYGRQCFCARGFCRLEEDNFWIYFIFYSLFLLEYSHFTALCQFLLYSKGNHQYIHIHFLPFGFPSYLGHQRALNRIPWAVEEVLSSYLFYM